jgi:hypothetical protein
MNNSRQPNDPADHLQPFPNAQPSQDASALPVLSDEDSHALMSLAISVASSASDDDEQTRAALFDEAADVLNRHPAAIHIYHKMLQTVTDLESVPAGSESSRARRRPVVASIRRSGSFLQWADKQPARVLRKTEMARDSTAQSELRFAERLSQCELEIQIETRGRSKFLVAVLITFLNPVVPAQQLVLRLQLEDGSHLEARPHNQLAEFSDVPAGTAELLILQHNADGTQTELDGLALQLTAEI